MTLLISANCCIWILFWYSASIIFFLRSVLKNKDLKSDISFLSDKHGLQKQHYYVCIHVTVCGLTTFNFTFSVFCIRVLVFLVILQKSDCGYCGFTCSLKPWRPLSHISPATLTCIRSPPHGREFALPMCLSNEISLFRLNSRCCSVSWWCLHGQFVPIFPRNGPPLPGPAEGQWGQHCQPGLRNGRQLHCYQHSQQ